MTKKINLEDEYGRKGVRGSDQGSRSRGRGILDGDPARPRQAKPSKSPLETRSKTGINHNKMRINNHRLEYRRRQEETFLKREYATLMAIIKRGVPTYPHSAPLTPVGSNPIIKWKDTILHIISSHDKENKFRG